MLKLVIKDFQVSRIYLLLLIAVLAIISVGYTQALGNGEKVESELYVIVVLLSAMISSKLFLLQEAESNSETLIAGLPLTRKQIVIGRYLSSFLMVVLVLVVHLISIQLGSTGTLRNENHIMYRPEMWIISGMALMLADALAFPFYFKFGLGKGALMYGATMIFLFFLTVFTIGQYDRSKWFQEFVKAVFSQPKVLLTIELIILFLLILWSSISISINVYKNKDL